MSQAIRHSMGLNFTEGVEPFSDGGGSRLLTYDSMQTRSSRPDADANGVGIRNAHHHLTSDVSKEWIWLGCGPFFCCRPLPTSVVIPHFAQDSLQLSHCGTPANHGLLSAPSPSHTRKKPKNPTGFLFFSLPKFHVFNPSISECLCGTLHCHR